VLRVLGLVPPRTREKFSLTGWLTIIALAALHYWRRCQLKVAAIQVLVPYSFAPVSLLRAHFLLGFLPLYLIHYPSFPSIICRLFERSASPCTDHRADQSVLFFIAHFPVPFA
jgi:hypothetical protein